MILLLILSAVVAIEIPAVQTFLTGKVAEKLDETFKGQMRIGSIHVSPFNALIIKDIYFLDEHPYTADAYGRGFPPSDTLFRFDEIYATFSLKGLLAFPKSGFQIKSARIVGGNLNLVTEPDGKYSSNIERILQSPHVEPAPPPEGPDIFFIKDVQIENFRFTMKNFNKPLYPYPGVGINFEDMDVSCNLKVRDLKFSNMIMSGKVVEGEVWEKGGCHLDQLKGKATVGRGSVLVEDLIIKDKWSDINLARYTMDFYTAADFADYVNKVVMGGVFRKSIFDWRTLVSIVGVLPHNPIIFDIRSGSMRGPVADMIVTDFDFTDLNSGVGGLANCRLTGLPDIYNTVFDIDLKSFDCDTRALSKFISGWTEGVPVDISSIARDVHMNVRATGHGTLNGLSLQTDIVTPAGDLYGDILLEDLLYPSKPKGIGGYFSTASIDLGRMLGIKALGESAFRTSAKIIAGAPGDLTIRVDSLAADRLTALGYAYDNVDVSGSFGPDGLLAAVSIDDPNLQLRIDAAGEGKVPSGHYTLKGDLPHADLVAVNLLKKNPVARVGMKLDGDFTYDPGKAQDGYLTIQGLRLEDSRGSHDIGDVILTSALQEGMSIATLRSSFLDMDFSGGQNPIKMVDELLGVTARRDLNALIPVMKENEQSTGNYDIDLQFKDTYDVLAFFVPGIYIEKGTSGRISLYDGNLGAKISSGRLAFGSNYLRNTTLELDNYDDRLSLSLRGEEINAAGFGLQSPTIAASVDDNIFGVGLSFDNSAKSSGNYGEILLDGSFTRDEEGLLTLTAQPQESVLHLAGRDWTVMPSTISLAGPDLKMDGFSIRSGLQSLNIHGGISKTRTDTVHVNINDLDCAIANAIVSGDYNIRGNINGDAFLYSPLGDGLELNARLIADSLSVRGVDAGTIRLNSYWDDEEKKLHASLLNDIGGRQAIDIKGFMKPGDKTILADASFDDMELGIIAPFISSILSSLDGHLKGSIHAEGPLFDLRLSSEGTRLDSVRATVAFTGVPYLIDGPINIDSGSITLKDLSIRDAGGGYILVNGGLRHKGFKDMALDARVRLEEITLLDSPRPLAPDSVYGTLFASGNATASGPIGNLNVNANVSTVKEGSVHIPLSNYTTARTSDILTFAEPFRAADPYDSLLRQYTASTKPPGNINVRGRVNITPTVEAHVDIDKSSGTGFNGHGSGSVELDLQTGRNIFRLNGGYTLSGGSFHFVVPGLTSKTFTIQDGSSISFGGDIMDSELDITANYNVKTSLASLIADSTMTSTRRNVVCGLHVSDHLSNPSVKFSVDIPDLEPSVQSMVVGSLDSDDKVQKQFVALLVLGTFVPSESSGIINGSDLLYSNVSDIMMSQVNSIFQKLEIPLDLGFNYQHSNSGDNLFDVAVSTQLFNNRVLVSGSVGNRKYNAGNVGTNMVGDLDMEIKLYKSGQLRLDLFSHSSDPFTNYLDFSQRNGVGFTYQKEYNRFADLLKSIFSSKEQRLEMEKARLSQDEKMVYINVEND